MQSRPVDIRLTSKPSYLSSKSRTFYPAILPLLFVFGNRKLEVVNLRNIHYIRFVVWPGRSPRKFAVLNTKFCISVASKTGAHTPSPNVGSRPDSSSKIYTYGELKVT